MRPRFRRRLLPVVLVLAGCSDDGHRFSTPTQPEPPEAAPSQVQVWSLRMTTISVTGKEDSCFWREWVSRIALDEVGNWRDVKLEIAEPESGGLELRWECEDDRWCRYEGLVSGLRFAAASDLVVWSYYCDYDSDSYQNPANAVDLETRDELEGSFSPDRRTLSAIERRTYREAGGEHIVTLEWSAVLDH